jgi:multiple sugar transport system substrate-binding protein
MSAVRSSFRLAVRQFGPFESALQQQWKSFSAATGCPLSLDITPLELPALHAALFDQEGLRRGTWDVALVVTDWLAAAHASHALLDLAPYLAAHPPADYPHGWTDSLLRHQRFGDAVLGLPYHDGPECLIYRRDLLAAADAAPPQTWNEFHALARRLHAPAENRFGTVFAARPDGHNSVYDFCLQLWTRGGELFDSSGRMQLRTPAAGAALEFYRAILNDPSAVHPACRTLDSVQTCQAFARGEVAMMVNWFGFAAMAETLGAASVTGHVAIAPLPAAPGHASASLNVYWLLAVAAGSPHADTAYAFLRHCASPENDKLLTLGGAIGCRKSTWQDPDVNRAIPFYHSLESLHARARELPRLKHWSHLAHVLDRLVVSAIISPEAIASLLARAQTEADVVSSSHV